MKSHITKSFGEGFRQLPEAVRRQGRQAYKLFKQNPYHPSLKFRQVHSIKPIYSVRIGIHYRAIGIRQRDEIIWYWIGSHAEYDRILSHL